MKSVIYFLYEILVEHKLKNRNHKHNYSFKSSFKSSNG